MPSKYSNFIGTSISMIRQWKGLHEYYNMETQKVDFFFFKKFDIEF